KSFYKFVKTKMNKYHYNMRVILTLIIAIVEFSSCNTQRGNYVKQNYEPYTEHQYLIRPVNDTLLAYLFKTTIPKEKIINFNEGKIIIELTIDTAGNVNAVVFNRIDNMILNEKTQVILVAKIKDKIKYEVDNDAKNYYAILGNPIRINHIILMKNLISKDSGSIP
ncbi:MAG TPA: hypothetical protein PLY69_06145, partial [Bacteroidales bacterium]|nr:hypothetical protein [Bacteroidales bacterium]